MPHQATKEATKVKSQHSIRNNYIFPFFLSIAFFVATNYGANMLNDISPFWGFILFVSSVCILFGYWTWVSVGWIGKHHRNILLVRIFITGLVIIIIFVLSPYYKDYFIKSDGSIEMPTFIDDSTQVLVHYGRRPNDFMFTQKTVGELKQNPIASLNINGEDIFYIHTEGNKLYVDAKVFAGYGNQTVEGYTPIGSSSDFSFQISGYIDTDNGSNKYYARKSGAFELRVDPVTSGTITASLLGQPVVIHDNALAQPVVIENNAFSMTPNGWRIQQNSMALEITNENNIPVLVLEYKSPYEITISGLFVTPFGILKVDNSKDVIFEFGDDLSELGTYKVDRIFIHSIFDLFRSERVYILK